jgi:hypothetical protein
MPPPEPAVLLITGLSVSVSAVGGDMGKVLVWMPPPEPLFTVLFMTGLCVSVTAP